MQTRSIMSKSRSRLHRVIWKEIKDKVSSGDVNTSLLLSTSLHFLGICRAVQIRCTQRQLWFAFDQMKVQLELVGNTAG